MTGLKESFHVPADFFTATNFAAKKIVYAANNATFLKFYNDRAPSWTLSESWDSIQVSYSVMMFARGSRGSSIWHPSIWLGNIIHKISWLMSHPAHLQFLKRWISYF